MTKPSENHHIALALVEDDEDLREEIVEALVDHGFDVRGFPASRELYLGLMQRPCDIAILDIGLPGEDGFSIMEHLRAATQAGIIMLTARGQTGDRVRALRGGADIYLVKPVDIEELAANIVSLARRLNKVPDKAPAPVEQPGEKTGTAFWRLSSDSWVLLSPGGGKVQLSTSERTVLEALMHQAGATVSRETLVTALGHHPDDVFSNRLDMLISRLRRKVQQATGEPLPLRSVRGAGFSLAPSSAGEQ